MALTRRNLSYLESKIEHHTRTAFVMLSNSLVYEGTNKPLDGTPLYVHLFGSTAPLTINTIATPEIVSLFDLMEGGNIARSAKSTQQGVGVLYNIPTPERILSSIVVPLTNKVGEYGRSLVLSLPCSEPVLRLRYWTNDPLGGPVIGTTNSFTNITAPLVDRLRAGIQQVYGSHTLATIDRILAIRDRLTNIEDRVLKYGTTSVASWGALYKKLPPLFTLFPNNHVQHVTMTRGAKDPDPALLEDLNLLAALVSAAPKE